MKIAILIFVTASLAYADERADYIRNLPKEQIIATIEHLQKLTREAVAEKDAAVKQNRFVTEKLAEAQQANESARLLAAQAEKEMAALRKWGIAQEQEAAKQKARADNEAKIARRRGMLLGYIMAALGLFIATNFARMIPMPYNLIAIGACAAAGFAIGRFLL